MELDERRQELRDAIAGQWEYELRESPEFATITGDYRYNDRWSDLSLEHIEQQKRDLADWTARFEAIDTTGFPEQEQLDHRLMLRNLREISRRDRVQGLRDAGGPTRWGPSHAGHFVSNVPLDSVEHYEQYVTG